MNSTRLLVITNELIIHKQFIVHAYAKITKLHTTLNQSRDFSCVIYHISYSDKQLDSIEHGLKENTRKVSIKGISTMNKHAGFSLNVSNYPSK